jgi:Rv0078B-related antitoxin
MRRWRSSRRDSGLPIREASGAVGGGNRADRTRTRALDPRDPGAGSAHRARRRVRPVAREPLAPQEIRRARASVPDALSSHRSPPCAAPACPALSAPREHGSGRADVLKDPCPTKRSPTETSRSATTDPTIRVVADDSPDILAARLQTAFDLFELGESMRRAQLRREHPHATDDEIEALLIAWLHTRPGAERGDSWGRPISWPPSRS